MTRPVHKLALTALVLMLPVCAAASPQYHETPEQLAANEVKSDQDAKTQWEAHCQAAFTASDHHKRLTLLSGPTSGYYYFVGKAVSDVVAEKTGQDQGTALEIEPIATAQTTCNLLGLEAGKADFALVQSDIAHDAWFGHPPVRSAPAQNISLVAPLFVEAVHIVVRPHLNLAHLSDLRGRRVWLGAEHSLTALTARRILDAAGLTSKDIAALEACPEEKSGQKKCINAMSAHEALDALKRLDLDAIFQVGAVPFDSLYDALVPHDTSGQLLDAERKRKPCEAVRRVRPTDPALLDTEVHLFNLDVDLVERLVADGSYVEQLIAPDAYCQAKATLTVGVRALLLTRLQIHDSDDGQVRNLAAVIQRHQKHIETNLRRQIVLMQKSHQDAVTGMPSRLSLLRVPTPLSLMVRYHPAITAEHLYFNPATYTVRNVLILVVALLIVLLLLYRFRRYTGPWLARRGGWAVGLTAPIILWVVSALVLKHYEGSVNEDFNTFPASLVSSFEDLVSYYFGVFGTIGNAPVTQTGQAALNWCARIFTTLCGLVLAPALVKSWLPNLWAIVKARLMRMGETSKPAVATDTREAPDHGAPAHPTSSD
jgi:TRAP transporter TAXI family solute receptor